MVFAAYLGVGRSFSMVDERAVRSLLERHGQVRRQAASDWRGTFPLPDVLSAFYESLGPVDVEIPGYGNPYYLPSLANLWDHQAGYRWRHPSGERLEDWLDDWLVVADEGGDPFILSRTSGRVHLAMHGQSVWEQGAEADEVRDDVRVRGPRSLAPVFYRRYRHL